MESTLQSEWDSLNQDKPSNQNMGDQVADKDATALVITKINDGSGVEKYLSSLRQLLQHCVNDDPPASSIGFLAPMSDHTAIHYWLHLFPTAIGPGPTTNLLIATTAGDPSTVIATAQIARIPTETHTYRGEVRKLLVHPAHRCGGVGRRMMDEVERMSRDDLGMEMLVLDTATATPARDFYLKTGWREWGICPDYAKCADGTKAECSFFVKMLQ